MHLLRLCREAAGWRWQLAALALAAGVCGSCSKATPTSCEGFIPTPCEFPIGEDFQGEVVPVDAYFSDDGHYLFFSLMRLGPDNSYPMYAGQPTRTLSYRLNLHDLSIVLYSWEPGPDVTKAGYYDMLESMGIPRSSLDICIRSCDGRDEAEIARSPLDCPYQGTTFGQYLKGCEHATIWVRTSDGSERQLKVGTDGSTCPSGTVFPAPDEWLDSCVARAPFVEHWTPWPCLATDDPPQQCDRYTEDGVKYCCCEWGC